MLKGSKSSWFNQKYDRGNHLPFMNKTLSKAIMHRTWFRINMLKIKLMKTKESIQNNKITVPHY